MEFVIPADEYLYLLNPDPLNIDPNSGSHRPLRADSDSLGFNAALNSTALVLTANLYDDGSGGSTLAGSADPTAGDLISTAIISIPKEDLLSAQVTNDPNVINNITSVSEGAYSYGINPQSVVSYDADSPALVLAQAAVQQTGGAGTAGDLIPTALELTTISGSGTSFSISGNPISIPLPEAVTTPIPAPQPNHAPDVADSTESATGAFENSALEPGLVDDGIDNRLSNVVEINGDLWVTQTVLDSTNTSTTNPFGTDAIAWYEIQPTFLNGAAVSGKVIQAGLLSSKGTTDPNLFFYFPSIAVNAAGDVVIGFDGSDTTQFISSYTAVGTTFAGVTTFTLPNSTVPDIQLVKSGTGVYTGLKSGVEPGAVGPIATPPAAGSPSGSVPPPTLQRGSSAGDWAYWGAYSATVVDPSNPNAFWTFQSITDSLSSSDTNTWGVQATKITIDQPAVTLSVSGPPTALTPLQLGVMGDNLSAGSKTDPAPGFVAQLTPTGGDFNVPVGANQAVDGALAAGLSSQLPEIETLAPSLNYTTIIIGENDALDLVNGTETAAQYTSTIETTIENAITTLQSKAPNDHLVVATVPDIFVTPEVEALNLSAATILTDEAVIQGANAEITQFALLNKVAVIDLYAAYAGLLGSRSLSLGGLTFTTTSATDPLFASDGFNPSAIVQGLFANMVIDAADLGFSAGLTPITDEQLVTNIGDTPTATGLTYINLAPYVLAPDTNAPITSETITATLSQASAHDIVVNLTFGGSGNPSPPTSSLPTINQFTIPNNATALAATVGPNGNIWFTALTSPSTSEVVEMNPTTGEIVKTYPFGAIAYQIVEGPGGNLWFLSNEASVDELNLVTGAFSGTEINSSSFSIENSIVVGPDGDLWFTDSGNNAIGRISASGNVTEFRVPIANADPTGLVVGPDGNLWFSMATADDIGSISVTGQFVTYAIANNGAANGDAVAIINGPNNNLWFTESSATSQGIGEMSTAGVTVANYPLADVTFDGNTFQPDPSGLVEGPDDNLYFSDSNTVNNIGGLLPPYLGIEEITPNGTLVPHPVESAPVSSFAPVMLGPDSAIPTPDGNIWFPIDGQAALGQIVFSAGTSTTPSGPPNFFASSQQIVILAGQTSGSVTLTGLGEPSALVVVGISSLEGAVENSPQQVTAVLTTDASIVTLGFSPTSFSEAGGQTTLTATLSAPSASGTVLNLSFAGGTATFGQDFSASAESIYIPAGQSTGSITLTGNGNLLASDETVIVTMTSVTGAYSQVPQQVTATLTGNAVTGASISGSVVESTNSEGMPGVIVYIDENGNDTFEPSANAGLGIKADPFTTTDQSGDFIFSGLPPSPPNYTLLEVVPAGFSETAPAGGSTTVDLGVGQQVTGIQFVNTPPTSSTNIVLSVTDLSGNTLTNPTFNENNGQIRIVATLPEVAANNVVINLAFSGSAVEGTDYVSSSQSIVILAGQTSGSITLTGLPLGFDKSGSPTVTVSIASVMNATAATSSVTAKINEQNDVLQGVVSGLAFQDNNYDGTQDNGEPNLANALVFIGPANNSTFNPATDYFTFASESGSTLGLGDFAFDGLVAGSYDVYQAPRPTWRRRLRPTRSAA